STNCGSSHFPPNFPRLLVVAQALKGRMAEKAVTRPFRKRNLCDQLWFYPAKLLHFVDRDAFAEMALAAARQVVEWTFRCQKGLHRFEKTRSHRRIESLAYFAGEKQFLTFVVANQDRLKTSRIRFVTANDELLRFIDLELKPRCNARTRAIERVALFCDHPFQPRRANRFDNLGDSSRKLGVITHARALKKPA